MIKDGESGYAHTDPQRLVERMRGLLDNPGEARALGLAARRAALERFNIGRFALDWDRALREICS